MEEESRQFIKNLAAGYALAPRVNNFQIIYFYGVMHAFWDLFGFKLSLWLMAALKTFSTLERQARKMSV